MVLDDPLDRADIPELCELFSSLLQNGRPDHVVCDVSGLADPDAVAVDALARLQLVARGFGLRLCVRNAQRQLEQLLELVGLNGVLVVEPRREAE